MVDFKVVKATQELIDHMKGRIRDIDDFECYAAVDLPGDVALQVSYKMSSRCWVGIIDEIPFCAFGVATVHETKGSPWLLGAKNFKDAWAFTLRVSKKHIQEMLDPYVFLENYVHVTNKGSIKWLKWCGFTVETAEPYGVKRDLFHRFWLRRGGYYV